LQFIIGNLIMDKIDNNISLRGDDEIYLP